MPGISQAAVHTKRALQLARLRHNANCRCMLSTDRKETATFTISIVRLAVKEDPAALCTPLADPKIHRSVVSFCRSFPMAAAAASARIIPLHEWGLRGNGLRKAGSVKFAAIGDGGRSKWKRKATTTTTTTQRQQASRAGLMVTSEKKVKVRLRIEHQVHIRGDFEPVQFGESHEIMGSAPCTGAWQDRVPLQWTEAGWVVELEANPQETLEYKHIIVNHNGDVVWEGGPNRVLSLPSEGEFEIVTHWDCTNEDLQLGARNLQVVRGEQEQAQSRGGDSVHRVEEISGFTGRWQGGGGERGEKWDVTGLDGPALQIVEGDKNARNWWQKLEVVGTLLTGELAFKDRFRTLVNIAVYLKWINTGRIACHEDGQHYPPNKHVDVSRRIFVELERIFAQRDVSLRELVVIRKIHLCLPSFKPEFTALTRILNIDDIPEELRQEIIHKLQNKLHRSAGPEDLVTTEALLARITKTPGEYRDAFVKEFKIFVSELKDFFNAGSLIEQLEALRPSIDRDYHAILEHFLWSKERLEALDNISGANIIEPLLDTIHALNNLRKILAKGLESGLRNDSSDEAVATWQKWRLAELGLEDYSSLFLNRMLNAFEDRGGASWLADEVRNGKVAQWTPALTSLAMGIQQLGLSGLDLPECIAINNELLAWSATAVVSAFNANDTKVWALRLKATVNRARRLASSYSDTVLQIYRYLGYVEILGNALGIPENAMKTYAEADVRASVVFQVSKICSLLLKAIRALVGGDGFDAIMPGRAAGMLIEVDRLMPGALPSSVTGPLILLVKKADCHDEVNAAGANVAGVVLQHELPHLSHLGVRAREEKVVFVTCDDEDKIAALRLLLNRPVEFAASSEFVHIRPYDLVPPKEETKSQLKETLVNDEVGPSYIRLNTLSKVADPVQHSVIRSPIGTVLDLSEATTENSGSKAAVCGALALLTEQARTVHSDQGIPASFCVPRGKVIPFGAMEDALERSSSLETFDALVERVQTASLEDLDSVCTELRSLIASQRVSDAVLDGLSSSGAFSSSARLIVRSSANVDDLAGMSGAGPHESVANVKLSEPESFRKATAQVWASLFSKPAVLSRRISGVLQSEASMAVLVQELLSPELSFVLHTVSPIDHDTKVLQAELAVGLGQTLASGTLGSPWRLAANKFDGTVKTLSFANFSHQVTVPSNAEADGTVAKHVVDYSSQALSADSGFREQVGQRLATVGFFLEQHFCAALDIEGFIVGEDVYVVQSRPQP